MRCWLLVAALVALVASAAAASASFVAWSLDTCRSDPVCAARFGLPAAPDAAISSYDVARFGEMLAVMAARQQDGDVGAEAVLGPCTDDAAPPGCSMAQWMWLGMLRQAQVCGNNEEWILGHGCSCIDGKHCADDHDSSDLASLWPFTLAVSIIGVFMLVIVIWDTRKSNEMERHAAQRYAVSLVAHYTLQAQLYLAEPAAPPPPLAAGRPSPTALNV